MPNAVAVDEFGPPSASDRVPDQLLFVGYLKESKGIETLLRATAVARSLRPSVTLRLIGRAPEPATGERWRRLAVELGLEDAVTFEGAADRQGIAAAMREAALFVHPSPRETFGVVAVEALASGLPVVATDSGGGPGPRPDPRASGPSSRPAIRSRSARRSWRRWAAWTRSTATMRRSVERRYGGSYVAERWPSSTARRSPPCRQSRLVVEEASGAVASARSSSRWIGGGRRRDWLRRRGAPGDDVVDGDRAVVVALPLVGRTVEVEVDTRWDLIRRRRRPRNARERPDAREARPRSRRTARRVLGRDGTKHALAAASRPSRPSPGGSPSVLSRCWRGRPRSSRGGRGAGPARQAGGRHQRPAIGGPRHAWMTVADVTSPRADDPRDRRSLRRELVSHTRPASGGRRRPGRVDRDRPGPAEVVVPSDPAWPGASARTRQAAPRR
jgi:hypothetical protein